MAVTPPKCAVCGAAHWGVMHIWGQRLAIGDVFTVADEPPRIITKIIESGETPADRKKRLTRERVARHRAKAQA